MRTERYTKKTAFIKQNDRKTRQRERDENTLSSK